MGPLALALCLAVAPAGDAPAEPSESSSTNSAWEAAGWGSPGPEPEPEPALEPDDAPAPETNSAWEAAGWGDPPAPAEPEPGAGEEVEPEGPVEGPEPGGHDAWEGTWGDSDSEGGGEGEARADAGADSSTSDKLAVGDVLAGSLRLTGSFLHYPDEPIYLGGDDALVLTVGRVLVEADAGEHVHFSFNGFGELSRVPLGASAGGNFASAGSTSSAYRTRYLTWQFWDNGAAAGQLGVDRVGMRLSFDSVNVDIGRFPITYTVANLFTINDFFAPFSATAVNRIYKPGVDAIRVSAGITATSSVDVVGTLGYDPETDRPSWGRSAVFTRVALVGAGIEWAALGGKVAQRWVAGGSIQAGLGPVDLRAEFHVGVPDEDGDGHGSDDLPIYGRAAGGPSLTFAWHNSVIAAEYMFASDGAKRAGDYIERALRVYTDDLPYLGQHYVGLNAGLEIIPILRAGVTGLVSATDGSGLAGVSVIYSVADESDLILGVFVPWGKGIRNFDPLAGTLTLGSEFGLAPLSAYLEARVFF